MKKGFTLVELLAVIVILGIIAVITIPRIQDVLYESQDDAYDLLTSQIVNKAKDYVNNNGLDENVTSVNPVDVYLSDLIAAGYIEDGDLADPRNSSDYIDADASYVRFTLENSALVSTPYFTITSND